jgi:hypothetical protein
LGGGEGYDDVKTARAETQGKELVKTAWSEPYEIWKLWMKFDCDGDGDPDDIVVYFHNPSGTILRAIYNPIFTANRPFVKFVGDPVEFSFDGNGACETLYPIQEAIDTLTNQHIDRLSIINSPPVLIRAGSGLESYRTSPGKTWNCDDNLEDSFREVKLSDVVPSTMAEKQELAAYAEKALGITPAVMGMQTAERPVFKETLANIEESNKKFKLRTDNYRAALTELAYQTLEFFAQYQPTLRYKKDQGGEWTEETVDIPVMAIRDGLDIDLMASAEMISQEVRREINMTVYQLLSDYMTKTAGVAQAMVSPQTPSDFKKVLFESAAIGVKLLKEILLDFEKVDAEQLVLDPTKVINAQKAIMTSMDLQPPQGPPPGQGGPPQGPPPGQGGPPQGPPGPQGPPPGPMGPPMGGPR